MHRRGLRENAEGEARRVVRILLALASDLVVSAAILLVAACIKLLGEHLPVERPFREAVARIHEVGLLAALVIAIGRSLLRMMRSSHDK